MSRFKNLLTAAAVILVGATSANAVLVTSVKRINIEQTPTNSPFWGVDIDDSSYAPAVGFYPSSSTPAGGSFAAVGNPKIGSVTSITSLGTFNIVGTSTSAGNWIDGNGIPAGITLAFNAQFTVSVGAGSPAGSYLTANSDSIGLGIAQAQNVYDTIDSVNLNDVPNGSPGDSDEYLDVSGVTVSNVSFTGTLAETGFNFTPGTVGNFGTYVIRGGGGNGFDETVETFGMFVENGPTDPNNPNKPTIGFGGPSIHQNEVDAGYGEGVVRSHVPIENSFSELFLGGVSTWYPRQVGAWRLDPFNGTLGVKGLGYEYDVTFTITEEGSGPDGDFNGDLSVDAADYVLWRSGFGTTYDENDYADWRANFGLTATGVASGGAVPEPGTVSLMAIAAVGIYAASRRAKRRVRRNPA
jgi:hypothetical protein